MESKLRSATSSKRYGLRRKFHNVPTSYDGVEYHSKLEARYAAELDLRVRAGEIAGWERQVRIPLVVNGIKICTYIIDFVEINNDGTKTYIEIKGAETSVWRLKWKLFNAVHGPVKAKVVYAGVHEKMAPKARKSGEKQSDNSGKQTRKTRRPRVSLTRKAS